ncbi:MAG: hypothetical protein IJX77_07840 [Ruminococcus sp.]|nr:hypothetical protein [Ruminococcus sp.]
MDAFFFFFDFTISELEELAEKLREVSAKIPTKAEIKELVVRTAKGE